MKLYLISQDTSTGPEYYSDAVVAAENEDAARRIHPGDRRDTAKWGPPVWGTEWAATPAEVSVKLLGEAAADITQGVILSWWHDG